MDSAGAASAAADSGHRPLHCDSLPLVDLRLLTQSELYSLSLSTSSASSAHDNGVLIPKIDRSVFNESAGSRKQTFSRLRLAPRGTAAASSSSSSSSLSRQKPPPPPPHEPLNEDNSRIISLLQRLFAKDAPFTDPAATAGPPIVAAGRDDDADLIQVRIEYDECLTDCSKTAVQSVPIEVVDLGPMKRKRGRPRKFKNSPILEEGDDAAWSFENDGEEGGGTATETKSNEDSVRLEDSMKVI